MTDYTHLLNLIEDFPSGAQLFPYKRYNSWEEFNELTKRPPVNENSSLREFQDATRTAEWRAASIVYEKYKRKMTHLNFKNLVTYITNWSATREAVGKTNHQDILVQELSKYIKTQPTTNT